jgi:hypothetical protein
LRSPARGVCGARFAGERCGWSLRHTAVRPSLTEALPWRFESSLRLIAGLLILASAELITLMQHVKWAGALCLALAGLAGERSHAAGSQVIGSFPEMSGGFEDELVTNAMPVVSGFQTGEQSVIWTVQNTDGTASLNGSGGRSGPHCVAFGTPTAKRLVSPTAASGAMTNTTNYIVQFYYRTSGSNSANGGQVGVCVDGTENVRYSDVAMDGTSGGWAKIAQTIIPVNRPPQYGIATFKFRTASRVDIDLDDFVVYAGTEPDTAPPSAPDGASIENSTTNPLTLAWGAAPGGVDGGGYMVVRNTNDPVCAPNVNGIYAVGNCVGSGPGSGSVAFLGTNTAFTDSDLVPGQTYFYRIYSADKAFNYSLPATASGATTTLSNSPSRMLPLRFSGNDVIVSFTGMAGRSYAVQSATAANGQWNNLATNSIALGTNTSQYTNQGVRSQPRFYRTRLTP